MYRILRTNGTKPVPNWFGTSFVRLPNQLFSGRSKTERFSSVWAFKTLKSECLKSEPFDNQTKMFFLKSELFGFQTSTVSNYILSPKRATIAGSLKFATQILPLYLIYYSFTSYKNACDCFLKHFVLHFRFNFIAEVVEETAPALVYIQVNFRGWQKLWV